MQDTAKVPRHPDGQPPARRPLIDEEFADQLLGKAQARSRAVDRRGRGLGADQDLGPADPGDLRASRQVPAGWVRRDGPGALGSQQRLGDGRVCCRAASRLPGALSGH
jgi:hypothetical protein